MLVFVAFVAAAAAAWWLLYTTPGAVWAVERVAEREPRLEEVAVGGGSLAQGVEVRGVRWRDNAVEIEVEAAVGSWDAGCLLRRAVCVRSLWVRGVDVAVAEEEQPEAVEREPLMLPELDLPWQVYVGDVTVHDMRLARGAEEWRLARLDASLTVDGPRWEIRRLFLERQDGWVEASGQVDSTGGYPLDLTVYGAFSAPGVEPRFQFSVTVGGEIAGLRLHGRLGGPARALLEAELEPLDPAVPFRLGAEEVAGGWPLATREQVALEGVTLTAEGDLAGAAFTVDGHLDGRHIPAGQWRGRGRATADEVAFDTLAGEVLEGAVEGVGRVGWGGDGVRWEARVEGRGLAPDTEWPGLPAGVQGRATVTGSAGAAGWELDLASDELSGRYRGRPVTVSGRAVRAVDGAWLLDDLRALSPVGAVRVDGRLGEDVWDLDVEAAVAELATLDPRVSGRADLRARIEGPPAEPGVVASGSGSGLAWEGYRVDALHFTARLPEAGQAPGAMEVTGRGVELPGVAFDTVRLTGDGTFALHALALDVDGPVVNGRLAATGGLDNWSRWRGLMTGASVAAGGERLDARTPVHLSWSGGRLALAAHCWDYKAADLCIEDVDIGPEKGEIVAEVDGFLFEWVEAWLPPAASWEGELAGRGAVRWGGGEELTANLALEGSEGRMAWLIGEEGDEAEHVVRELAYERLSAAARYREGWVEAELDFVSEAAGHARLTVGTDPRPGRRELEGSVEVEVVRLGFVRTFLPEITQVSGDLSAHGDLTGTWRDPEFRGSIHLANGQFSAPEWPLRVEDLDLVVDVDGDEAGISGSFRSGEGRAAINGTAVWPGGEWVLAVDIMGRELAVSQPPLFEALVNPDLSIRLAHGEVRVDGSVAIASGAVTVHEIPWRAAPHSRDVVVLEREVEDEADLPDGWGVEVDVTVTLGEALTLTGFGVRGRLAGELRLRQTVAAGTEAFGEIRIEDGVYEAYGQHLVIRRGLLVFFGPAERPRIEVEAVRRIERDRVTAGVRVEGFADDPTVTLFSEPPMSQDDALSYMVRGRPMGREGPEGDDLLAHAALALGVYGGTAAAATFAEQLGIQEFDIEAVGTDEGAQVVLSGYLSPRIYVAYGVGVFLPSNTVTLRYYLTWQLYLEAVSGVESALDLMYRFEID